MPYCGSTNGDVSDQYSPKTAADSSNVESRPPSTQPRRSHFYTNAAPTKIEGNVFRYDFDEQVRIHL